MKRYLKFNKLELVNKLQGVEVKRVDNVVITFHNKTQSSIATVSNRYEVFDFQKYFLDRLEQIQKNFSISEYNLEVKGGVQFLSLVSDSVMIGDLKFYKVFNLLNSTDRSRRLCFTMGLVANDVKLAFHIPNMQLHKKHYTGINQLATDISQNLNEDIFNEQIAGLQELSNSTVYFGDLFDLLNDTESKTFPETFHKFRRILAMRYLSTDSAEYLNLQRSPNHFNPELVKGVSFGGLDVVMNYMQVFREKDSVVVTKETEKIMQATLKAVRNRKLMEFADFD